MVARGAAPCCRRCAAGFHGRFWVLWGEYPRVCLRLGVKERPGVCLCVGSDVWAAGSSVGCVSHTFGGCASHFCWGLGVVVRPLTTGMLVSDTLLSAILRWVHPICLCVCLPLHPPSLSSTAWSIGGAVVAVGWDSGLGFVCLSWVCVGKGGRRRALGVRPVCAAEAWHCDAGVFACARDCTC